MFASLLKLPVLFLSASVVALSAVAETKSTDSREYLIDVWNADKGLPNSTVTSIAQTPDGYLWISTLQGGLARFDGVRFVTLHPGNTPELRSTEIQHLATDDEGTLWIGNVEGGLISRRNGVFRFERQSTLTPAAWFFSVVSSRGPEAILSSIGGSLWRNRDITTTNQWESIEVLGGDRNSAFCRDRDGKIWYRRHDGRLGWFDGTNWGQVGADLGLRTPVINALLVDKSGRLWVGTARELALWDGQHFLNMNPTNGPDDVAVQQLAYSGDGGLWVRTTNQLGKIIDGQWIVWAAPWDGNFHPVTRPLEMHGDSRGGVWLAHYGDGMWHVDNAGKVFRFDKETGLPSGAMECWFEDREGNVWAGITDVGLVRLRRRAFRSVWPDEQSPARAISSVCKDPDGTIWFGTTDGACFRSRDGVVSNCTPPTVAASVRDVTVVSDKQNRLWCGTLRDGVWIIETNSYYRPFPPLAVRNVVRALFSDREGRIWIGNDFGLYCWSDGNLKAFSSTNGFSPAYISAITQSPDGAMWFGTATGELRRWRDGKFDSFRPDDNFVTASPLSAQDDPASRRGTLSSVDRFASLYADRDGTIWIGTLVGGLLRFADGKFTRIGTKDGLPNEHVSQIVEDLRGQLWFGTRAGIACVSKESLNQFARGELKQVACVTYGKFDGLPTVECSSGNQPNAWADVSGRLWFATMKGLVSVLPKEIPVNPIPPKVVIEEVRIEGESIYPESRNGSLEGNSTVRVKPGRHYLEIHFTGLSFTAPDRVRFRWKLEGLETDWIEGKANRSASYSFLQPRDYQFRVTACNNDGVWNETGATVKIVVVPYLWQTRWFQFSALFVVIAAVATTVWIVAVRKARERLREVERQHALERERMRIAKDIHDDLGGSLTYITMLGQSARSHLSEFPQAGREVEQICGTARELTRAMEEVVWAVSPKHDSLDSLLSYLGNHTQDFAAACGLRCRLDLPTNLSDRSLGSQVRHNVFLAFKEALNNIVKHAAATEVRIAFKMESTSFTLTIEDNGCGLATERLSPALAQNGERLPRLLTGQGLSNMRSRLEEIGGSCTIENMPERGTRVNFVVPLSHKCATSQFN